MMISVSERSRVMVLSGCMLLALFPLTAGTLLGGESCAMMSGICRDKCGAGETAEMGDFMDCGEKQDCCVASAPVQPAKCCIGAASGDSGKSSCTEAKNGTCASGTASPLPCYKLPVCR